VLTFFLEGSVVMLYLRACLLIVFGVAPVDSGEPSWKDAQQRLLRGNYAEARELFEILAKQPQYKVAAVNGISRALQSEGEYDTALAVLDAALKDAPRSANLLAARAEVFYLRGRWDEAQKAAKDSLAVDQDQFLAHWVLAQLHRDRGDFKKAGEELIWFVRAFAKHEDSINDPDRIMLVCLAELERARWDKRLLDQFDVVLNDLLTPLARKHKDYWPAEYEAGRLFLEKYNHAKALPAFDKALAINPRAAEVLVSKGVAAFERFDIAEADQLAEHALQINPRLTAALRLQADIHIASGAYDEAFKALTKARDVNPREEATLARVAACFFLQGRDSDFQAVVKEVQKQNPKAGLFYSELAKQLDERKRFLEAEKFYKQALKLRPNFTAARNQLGLLYMRLGQEEDARSTLEEAARADPFNVRVVNSLKVLDHLDGYATLQTEHFVLRFDPQRDKILARFLATYLENTYRQLAELFDYRPPGPFLIELFNNHDMFSGRVLALPDLHTVGACTGRIMAMVSPRDKAQRIVQPFNWARVVRHELVHVFNLDQTGFKVPHWFTEGLAVGNEGFPMPPMWHHLLRKRVADGELFNLDNILLGFVRPASGEDWQLAYLQSYQYVEYLKKTHGKERIGEFLRAYADGLSTDAAIQKYCKVSKADFETGYRRHLADLAEKLAGKQPQKVLSFKELEVALAKEPDNADLNAQLAERFLLLGDRPEAQRLADKAAAKQPNHPLAACVLARLLEAGDRRKALAILDAALDPAAPDPKVLRLLGSLRFESKEYSAAARLFELGRKAEPHESSWLIELSKIYRATNDTEKLTGVLIDLAPTDADDLETRRLLAQLQTKAGRHAEAERYAREGLEIDVLDTACQKILEAALRAQNKIAEADELMKLFQ
jgi:cellulose synthase operon protein C